jgi:hypothetical protein
MAADGDHQRSQADERSDTGADPEHEAKRNAGDDGDDQGPSRATGNRDDRDAECRHARDRWFGAMLVHQHPAESIRPQAATYSALSAKRAAPSASSWVTRTSATR